MGSFMKPTKICASSQSHRPQSTDTTKQNPIHFPFHQTHRFFAFLLNRPYSWTTPPSQTLPASCRQWRNPKSTELVGPQSRSMFLTVHLFMRSISQPNPLSVSFCFSSLFLSMKLSSIVSKFDFRCVTLFDRHDYGVLVDEEFFVLLIKMVLVSTDTINKDILVKKYS